MREILYSHLITGGKEQTDTHMMHSRQKSQSGFTLIELMIVIIILVIVVTMAAPSFVDTLDRRRVINATQALTGQIQQARSTAILRNQNISIVIRRQSDTQWCFGLTDVYPFPDPAQACNCQITDINAATACTIGVPEPGSVERILARVDQASYQGVALGQLASNPLILSFEPTRGLRIAHNPGATISPTPLFNSGVADSHTFLSPRGLTTRVNLNVIGRVNACSPSSNTLMGGINPC